VVRISETYRMCLSEDDNVYEDDNVQVAVCNYLYSLRLNPKHISFQQNKKDTGVVDGGGWEEARGGEGVRTSCMRLSSLMLSWKV